VVDQKFHRHDVDEKIRQSQLMKQQATLASLPRDVRSRPKRRQPAGGDSNTITWRRNSGQVFDSSRIAYRRSAPAASKLQFRYLCPFYLFILPKTWGPTWLSETFRTLGLGGFHGRSVRELGLAGGLWTMVRLSC